VWYSLNIGRKRNTVKTYRVSYEYTSPRGIFLTGRIAVKASSKEEAAAKARIRPSAKIVSVKEWIGYENAGI
jgi:hypothetical protein